jgi:HEAT repeat protein
LIDALRSGREQTRIEAIDALGSMGDKAAGAVEALAGLLQDESAAVRAHAAESLGEIGSPAKAAAPALMSAITDPDATVRREAIDAVRAIRPGPEVVLPLFVKQMETAEPAVRMSVLSAIAEEGEAAVPNLIEALKNEDAAYWACLVLGEIGPDAKAAVPALIEVLDRKEPGVRREAILALAEIGEAAAPAVPALAKALDCEINCVPATFALGKIGRIPTDVQAKIRQNARSSDNVLSTVSLWALAKLHPDDEALVTRAVRKLVQRLTEEDPRHREAAANALVDLDPDPEILRPILKKAMDGASPEVLDAVMDVFAQLGEKVLPRLINALEVEEVRLRAAAIIARIGPPAKAAVPALVEALGDESSETRSEVLLALAAIGPDAASAVPAVTKAVRDPDMNVRYAACYALGRIGPAAMPAKEELRKCLSSADQFLGMASAWALAQVDPQCSETAGKSVPLLTKALEAPDAMTRLHAIEALCCLGPLAKDAVPALKRALQDANEDVRAAAAEALREIGG